MASEDAPELVITLNGPFYLAHVERLLRELQPLLHLTEPVELIVDCRRLTGIGPAGLAILKAALARAQHLGFLAPFSRLQEPRTPNVRQYMQRMDLLEGMTAPVDEEFTRHRAHGFRPCRQFIDDRQGRGMAKDFTAALTEVVAVDEVARLSIEICLTELAENVWYHADTDIGGFAVAQSYRRRHAVEIAVADLGIGVRASLTKNETYQHIEDDVSALSTALQPRVTSTPERNGGIGLFITKMLLRANGGHLFVRSGLAAVKRGAEEADREVSAVLPGTLVVLRARTDRPLDIHAVYDMLHTPDDDDDD